MPRVGIIALLHESNTFLDQPTTLAHFEANILATGPAACDAFRASRHEVAGFLAALEGSPGFEAVGVFAARAMPFGTIAQDCWQQLMGRLEASLRRAGRLDGVLVAPHGATVAEGAIDADGDWLQRVREFVGPACPMIGTLDLHANISARMVAATDALLGYQTNPHLDQFERGLDAGQWMVRTLRGEMRPQMAFRSLPLCVNIERQATDEPQGRALRAFADQLQSRRGLLNVSCLYGFPYADVPEMGATVLAVSERDRSLAEESAAQMAAHWWAQRELFRGRLLSIDEALRAAADVRRQDASRPVGLLDMGDNVGGGGPGDATEIVHGWRMSELRHSGRLLTVLADPVVVEQAFRAGLGARLETSVGGRMDPARHGPPFEETFIVSRLSDGRFEEPEVRHGGYRFFDQGPTAVLVGVSGVTVIATTQRVAPLSLQQVVSQGLTPEEFAAIVIKGVHAPVAAYRQACSKLIRVNSPGVTSADLAQFTFRNRRQPMEPWESVQEGL
jgi:microcystin degradation protein MlrC